MASTTRWWWWWRVNKLVSGQLLLLWQANDRWGSCKTLAGYKGDGSPSVGYGHPNCRSTNRQQFLPFTVHVRERQIRRSSTQPRCTRVDRLTSGVYNQEWREIGLTYKAISLMVISLPCPCTCRVPASAGNIWKMYKTAYWTRDALELKTHLDVAMVRVFPLAPPSSERFWY